jgi:bcr-type benzoyl-CoA reductase subunit C
LGEGGALLGWGPGRKRLEESGREGKSEMTGSVLQTFSEAAAGLTNPALQRWKDRGGRVVGYFCSAVPEEILVAAGLLSFRMRATGSESTEESDAYFSNINCSFPRNCFNLALIGEFEFLDGVICLNSCDHVRRLYDNWKRYVPTEFVEIMSLPRKTGPEQVGWYRDELAVLKEKVEKHFDVEISDEKLRDAIRLLNETRSLQRKLYELRKRDRPPLTGADALAVMVAGTAMPREEYNDHLRSLLDELDGVEGADGYRARLMVVGGILDDPAWVKIVEDQGGLVVTDATCFGTRIMWEQVDESIDDPLAALAQYYVADRPSCPRMYGEQESRSTFVRELYKEFNCDGIIGERLNFCDQWLVEHFMLDHDLKEESIPFLKLDREYVTSGAGQTRTRVQAFLETMGK